MRLLNTPFILSMRRKAAWKFPPLPFGHFDGSLSLIIFNFLVNLWVICAHNIAKSREQLVDNLLQLSEPSFFNNGELIDNDH